ncbi:uncharacterized protein EHS24_004268 [Apiotrichum porosum]|uniref:Isochorismatase-like domain-containing protein n=1 Tax=Apiotrichum porosum TaxID=105984 RepID=A0A427Y4P4_9TREE|nr:uncharacterized protein EHS24_004268 [Apiotrichum porosum]RSH86059.1 hypothetical protein EHS24_004268 [Apiotrichum porosum]
MQNFPASILNPTDPCSPLSVPPAQTALLLLDLHKFILSHQPDGGKSIVESAVQLRTWAQRRGIAIVHCLLDLEVETPAHMKMSSRTNAISAGLKDTPEHKGEADAVTAPGELTFTRVPACVSAMESTGLQEWLKAHGIRSVILAGLSSSGCVINTAKAAADQGLVVTVVKDACKDRSAEVHEIIMTRLLVMQSHIVDIEELDREWERQVTA